MEWNRIQAKPPALHTRFSSSSEMDKDLLTMTDAGLKCHCPDGEDKDVLSSSSLVKKMLSFWIKSLWKDLDVKEHFFHEKQKFSLLSHVPHHARCVLAGP